MARRRVAGTARRMIVVGIGMLVIAALLIAFFVWMRHLAEEDLRSLAASVRYDVDSTDEWERPRIVRVEGGIYDVIERGEL